MLSSLNIECPTCKSVYTLAIEELNVVLLFRCSDCGQYNVYVAGHVLSLDHQIMEHATRQEQRKHVVEVLQLWACEFAGNVLRNAKRVVDVNLGLDLREEGAPDFQKSGSRPEAMKPGAEPPLPSSAASGHAITDEEVRDFKHIDLHLIDRKWYFDKVFGDSKRKKGRRTRQ